MRQYVDTGICIPKYQIEKLNKGLMTTYLRKRLISAKIGGEKINIDEFNRMNPIVQNESIFYTHNVYYNLSPDVRKKYIKSFLSNKYKDIKLVYKDLKKGIFINLIDSYPIYSTFYRGIFDEYEADYWKSRNFRVYVIFDIKKDLTFTLTYVNRTDNSSGLVMLANRGINREYLENNKIIDILDNIDQYQRIKTELILVKVKKEYNEDELNIYGDEDKKISNLLFMCDARLEHGDRGKIVNTNNHNATNYLSHNCMKYSNRLLNILIRMDFKRHLDIIFNFFQNVKFIKLYKRYSDDYYTETYVPYETTNLNIFEFLYKYNKVKLEQYNSKLKEMFTSVLYSTIELNNDTKKAIFNFMDDMGVDMLTLMKNVKAKKGEDLTEREFNMLDKRKVNLDTVIINKMKKIREDEDVTFTTAEILYAIEKTAYRKYFKKHFEDSLKEDPYQPIDYDLANILKKLDLMNYVYKLIKTKADEFGLDSLNSIEKSIYDIGGQDDK